MKVGKKAQHGCCAIMKFYSKNGMFCAYQNLYFC